MKIFTQLLAGILLAITFNAFAGVPAIAADISTPVLDCNFQPVTAKDWQFYNTYCVTKKVKKPPQKVTYRCEDGRPPDGTPAHSWWFINCPTHEPPSDDEEPCGCEEPPPPPCGCQYEDDEGDDEEWSDEEDSGDDEGWDGSFDSHD